MFSRDGLGRRSNVRESLSSGEIGGRGVLGGRCHRSGAGSARRYYVRAPLDPRQGLESGLCYAFPARLRGVCGNHDRRLARRRSEALDEVRRAEVLWGTEAVMA